MKTPTLHTMTSRARRRENKKKSKKKRGWTENLSRASSTLFNLCQLGLWSRCTSKRTAIASLPSPTSSVCPNSKMKQERSSTLKTWCCTSQRSIWSFPIRWTSLRCSILIWTLARLSSNSKQIKTWTPALFSWLIQKRTGRRLRIARLLELARTQSTQSTQDLMLRLKQPSKNYTRLSRAFRLLDQLYKEGWQSVPSTEKSGCTKKLARTPKLYFLVLGVQSRLWKWVSMDRGSWLRLKLTCC